MFRLVTTYRVVIEKEYFHAMHLFHHALHIDRNGLTHVHHEAAGDKARIYKVPIFSQGDVRTTHGPF